MANLNDRLRDRPAAPLISFVRWDYLITTILLAGAAVLLLPA